MVVVSDHGMIPVHTTIDANTPIAELGAYAINDGGIAHIYLTDLKATDTAAGERVLAEIADRLSAWRIGEESPIERIFTRREAARIGLDHPNSGDLIVFARPGYVFRALPKGKTTAPPASYGAHGYLGSHPEVQALYMAIGAGVKRKTGGRCAPPTSLRASRPGSGSLLRIGLHTAKRSTTLPQNECS